MSAAKPKDHPMTRQEYLEYIDYFNKKDFDEVTSYFAPDITVEYYDTASDLRVPARTLYGPKGFIDNYKALFESVKEVLELGDFLSTQDRVFAELYTEFHPLKDTPASEGRQAWKKGRPVVMTNWVMKRIRIAHFRNHDPKTAKYKP
jgi:hypothetical protein